MPSISIRRASRSCVSIAAAAFRSARAANAVALIQYESTQKGTDKISMDEINAEIGAVRSKRKK
jgi:hypothetical protein